MSDYLDLLEDELREAVERRAGSESRPSRRSPSRLGWLVPAAAALLAVVIAGGALLLVRHGRGTTTTRPASAQTRGRILDASGGVLVGDRARHEYPYGSLAVQILGVRTTHGATGLEQEYNSLLSHGEDLRTSLHVRLQQVAQRALDRSIAENGSGHAGGAFIAMDPQTGRIYAMGSAPTLNPNAPTREQYGGLTRRSGNEPFGEGRVMLPGPVGSTFKVITAAAALESGTWNVGETYDDTGHFCFPATTDCLHNSGEDAYGVIDLQKAIQVSDDVFFYNLGYQMNSDNAHGGPLQTWARRFGIGERTGIDLPRETAGYLPSPGLYRGERWAVGDNVNTAVGQGAEITPLQLAVVYAALENGGTIVTPHIGEDIQSSNGTVVQRIDPPAKRHLHIRPANLVAIRQGLRLAAGSSGGTSYDVMGRFPLPVYGESGTAQHFARNGAEEMDNAWYACYVPASATSTPIVVVVTVAHGGFGDVAAAPVAHEILSEWFLGHPGTFHDGVEVGDGL